MPLVGYDVVLGTYWMAPLGDITWNLAAGTMAFQHAGRSICWRGTAPKAPARLHAAEALEPLLDALLADLQDVFAAPSSLPPERVKALVWFWIIDETLLLTSILSVCRLNEVHAK
jgi:hypothetical protein